MENTNNKALFYFIMLTMTLISLLIIGELFARLFITPETLPKPPPFSTIDPYKANPYILRKRPYLFFHIPHSKYIQARSSYQVNYEINAMGFRGTEISPKTGLKRLITIGDSITEGHGNPFQQTFSYRLGENLRQYDWEVINMGVQGGSPLYYAANLERYLSVRPDAVLIVIFENDISDDRTGESVYFTLPFLDNEQELLMKTPTKAFLSKFRLYTLLQRSWKHFVHSPVEAFEDIIIQNQKITYTAEEQKAIKTFEEEQTALSVLQPRPKYFIAPAAFDKEWEKSQAYLDYIVSSFHQRGIAVMITNLSVTGQEPGLNPAYREHASTLDQKVSKWAAKEKLPFLSLLPTISRAVEEHQLHFHTKVVIEDDGHPTPETHARIERTLRPWVINSLEMK
ncbi:MAG: SGNH/GDSL hydrolase family protein [Thiomargarita sp.]|nr:SGNH/GDSL hydrolase family protein [Thiomargarita sp.]